MRQLKAEDLQVGDWVLNTHNGVFEQVKEIRENMVMLAYNDLYDYDEIEPIELTDEMLLTNGFHKTRACSNREWEGHGIRMNMRAVRVSSDRFIICKYLHELQQLFRLCMLGYELKPF